MKHSTKDGYELHIERGGSRRGQSTLRIRKGAIVKTYFEYTPDAAGAKIAIAIRKAHKWIKENPAK